MRSIPSDSTSPPVLLPSSWRRVAGSDGFVSSRIHEKFHVTFQNGTRYRRPETLELTGIEGLIPRCSGVPFCFDAAQRHTTQNLASSESESDRSAL